VNALVKPALKPGIYEGLSMEEYLAMPACNASLLQTLMEECPYAAWFDSWLNPKPPDNTSNRAQGAGTIAHAILLEGNSDCVCVIDPSLYPTKTTGNIPDGWTNKDIRAARDAALAAGKIPVLVDHMAEIEAMVDAARGYLESLRESEPAIWAAFQLGGGDSETTLVWDEGGVLFRIRPDRMSRDRKLITDYKTGGTTAEPDTWGRTQMVRMGYYTSAAFYRRGVKALCGAKPDYVFLVQEQEAPYLCSLVGIDPAGYELGERKIARATSTWRSCVKTGTWPAYPNRVCYAEIPPWEFARAEEEAESHGIPFDPAKFYPSRDELARTYDALPE
jgi:hypothetical protein